MFRWLLLLALFAIGSAHAQPVPYTFDAGTGTIDKDKVNADFANVAGRAAAPFLATGGLTARTQADRATDQLWAPDFGTCTWDATHDVGPCINAAIAKAASLGGRTVVIPAGAYGLGTPLVNNTPGVHLVGMGMGIPRDNMIPGTYQAVTRLIWIGAAGATMLDVEPVSTAVPSLFSADVSGIVFDCASLANVCVKIAQTSASKFEFGVSEPRSIGAYLTTTTTADSPGTQNNDIWIEARSTNAAFTPTGILIDGGIGSTWNVSYNRFRRLYAWYYKGDGIVFGNSDNNVIYDLATFPQPGATGTPVTFAATGYTPPNGIPTTGVPYTTRVIHTGTPVTVQGFTAGLVVTQNGANTGTAVITPKSLTTNASAAANQINLTFASTTGVAPNMSANCGGPASGVVNDDLVGLVAGGTVSLGYYTIGIVAASTVCNFGIGATSTALLGTYTLTATSPTLFNLTSPGGTHNQTAVALAAGVLTFNDLVIPFTGAPIAGDSWTIVVANPPNTIVIEGVDKANSVVNPHYSTGSSGSFIATNSQFPTQPTANSGILLTFASEGCSGKTPTAGAQSITFGDCGGVGATGPFAVSLGGVGNQATGFGSSTFGGHNNAAAGTYAGAGGEGAVVNGAQAWAFGETVTAGGSYSNVTGGFVTDRGRFGGNCYASGQFAVQGDAQSCVSVLRATGAAASAVRLTADQGAAGAANCINLPNNSAYSLLITMNAFDHTTPAKSYTASWGLGSAAPHSMARGATAASTLIDGVSTSIAADVSRSVGTLTGVASAIIADTTNGCLNLTFTPPTSNTDTWNAVATVQTVEAQ